MIIPIEGVYPRRRISIDKKKVWNIVKYPFYIVPLLLGFWGFSQETGKFSLEVIYATLRLYGFNMDIQPDKSGMILWIAGFWAICVTTSIVFSSIKSLYEYVKFRWITINKDNVINVIGNEHYINLLIHKKRAKERGKAQPSKRASDGERKLISSYKDIAFRSSHIIVFGKDRKESLEFFDKIQPQVAKRKGLNFYIHSEGLGTKYKITIDGNEHNVITFDIFDRIAKYFWRDYDSTKRSNKIVFIGFGRLGHALLLQALQNNVMLGENDELLHHQYHVVGDASLFIKQHKQLDQFLDLLSFEAYNSLAHSHAPYKLKRDMLITHTSMWDNIDNYLDADTVIFCDDNAAVNEKNMRDFNDLIPSEAVRYVYVEDDTFFEKVDKAKVHTFPNNDRVFTGEAILNSEIDRFAKEVYTNYKKVMHGSEEDTWNTLSSFERRSNEAQAEHLFIKLKMLDMPYEQAIVDHNKLQKKIDSLSEDQLDKLAELEHIRWCRFLWLNNWKYVDRLENSASKDEKRRLHTKLKDFKELKDDKSLEYNIQSIQVIPSIINNKKEDVN